MSQHFDLDLGGLEENGAVVRMPKSLNPDKEKRGEVDFITIHAPSLQGLLRLGKLVKSWNKSAEDASKSGDPTDEDALDLIDDFVTKIESLVPEVRGYDLPIDKLRKVVFLAISLATPAEMKELERRGLSVNADDKKKGSVSFTKSRGF